MRSPRLTPRITYPPHYRKYSNIDTDTRSRDLKNALNLLALAGVVKPIYLTKASGLPLGAQIDEQKFKLNFLDVGLMQNSNIKKIQFKFFFF